MSDKRSLRQFFRFAWAITVASLRHPNTAKIIHLYDDGSVRVEEVRSDE